MYTTQIDHMNLHQIANSGQCFRWQQINNNTYKIPAFGRELTISQDGNTFILSCDEDEWNSLWKNYFDVDTDTDYNEVENIIMESNDDFLKNAYQFGSGIRILRQDLWETIVSFIISQNNNIPRIKRSIEKLCENNGGKFPDIHDLQKLSFIDCGLGYRDEYLKAIAEQWSDWDRHYPPQNYDEWKYLLKSYKGIGDKVANCILLFALHYLDAFPIDVHIQKIIDREYRGELPEWAKSKYAGLFQRYIFYYSLNHKEK